MANWEVLVKEYEGKERAARQAEEARARFTWPELRLDNQFVAGITASGNLQLRTHTLSPKEAEQLLEWVRTWYEGTTAPSAEPPESDSSR